jgi:hypothetical protein
MQYQVRNNWLGREDSNLRVAESKSAALPLGEAPIPFFNGFNADAPSDWL